MSDKKRKISVFSVIEVIVIIILVIMIAGMVFCNLAFRKDGSATSVFGYSFYKTRAVNMIPKIPVDTVIVAKKSEIPNIQQHSVILCNIGEHTALIRVTDIQEESGKKFYIVKFDTSPDNETFRVDEDAVIAKAVWQLEYFGSFLEFATSVPGIIVMAMIPLIFLVLIQLVRIKNLHKLEREASELDDGVDLIFKKSEALKAERNKPAVISSDDFFATDTVKEPEVKTVVKVDERGKADFAEEKKAVPVETSPLFTYNKATGKVSEPVLVGAATENTYINQPTKMAANSVEDDIFSKLTKDTLTTPEEKSEEKAVLSEYISNIIPENIASVQENAAAVSKSPGFDESVRAYYDKQSAKKSPVEETVSEPVSTIPEKAVVPKEPLAPVKKKKSSNTIAELMSIIDSEESKLKK